MPNPNLLTSPLMRREAVLSSRIEGTLASLSDLFTYEATRRPRGDEIEVANYVDALEEGIDSLEKLPVCVRLANQLHSTLLKGVRGQGKRPGEIRNEQVWIGPQGTPLEDARFVPPPAQLVLESLGDWERFANEDSKMPPLVRCALLHYQFEAIHPYLEGNGRIGRLLIVLFLQTTAVLTTPLLYLSAYFERDREAYYDHLYRVSATGDWLTWIGYFLAGIEEQSLDALTRVRELRSLQESYSQALQGRRASANTLRLADEIFGRPVMTASWASELLGITNAGAMRILERLAEVGILTELPAGRFRIFIANELLKVVGG